LQPLSPSQRQMLTEAVEAYRAALADTETALDAWAYLTARDLDVDDMVRTHRLGVVTEPMVGHERYRGWLAIPYLSAGDDRHPVQLRFRCLQEHDHKALGHGKYATISGERGRMYGVQNIPLATDTISLCEGELDAITLTACGFPAVAVPGASAWQSHYRRMLAGFSKVYVWADPDEAGFKLLDRVMKALPQARPVKLTEGDVNDTYGKHGKTHIQDLVREA
jgi:5S rRNA maturation endonuclease (ribonuclease M5)